MMPYERINALPPAFPAAFASVVRALSDQFRARFYVPAWGDAA
jgi:hypothetical protein